MKIFMDTADVDEIVGMAELGIVYGVTTNPSLIAKSGRTQAEVISEICKLVTGPVSAEVISTECAGMVREARQLAQIADNIVVKIPCIAEGLKAVRILSAEGIKTTSHWFSACRRQSWLPMPEPLMSVLLLAD